MGMIMASPIHSDFANRARQAYEEMREVEQQQRPQSKTTKSVDDDTDAANNNAAIAVITGNGRAQLVTSLNPAVEERIAYELRQIAHLRALWWRRDTSQLDEREKKLIHELRRRDSETKQHEQAHIAAGGSLIVSGPSYKFITGPDGRNYAIGGQVSLDITPEHDPHDTLKKAEQIERTAMAPMKPSPQDFRVVNQAKQLQLIAEQQIALASLAQRDQLLHQNTSTSSDLTENSPSLSEEKNVHSAQKEMHNISQAHTINAIHDTEGSIEHDQQQAMHDESEKKKGSNRLVRSLYLETNFSENNTTQETMNATVTSINLFI